MTLGIKPISHGPKIVEPVNSEVRPSRVLFIGGWHLLHGLNHASRHWAEHLVAKFKAIDLIGYNNFYGGPPAPWWRRAARGIRNLTHSTLQVSGEGQTRSIAIRDIYAPSSIGLLVKELWRYIILRGVLVPPYQLAFVCHPGDAGLAWLLKRSGKVEHLVYLDWDYHPGWETGFIGKKMMEIRENVCVQQADVVITVNHLLAELRYEQGAKDVQVVPNGVNLSLFSNARDRMPHPPTLIYMGSLSPLWGVDIAIQSMPYILKAIPDARLLIAGIGHEEPGLRALADSLRLSKQVHFLGKIEYEALPKVLAEADIGLATSRPASQFRRYATPLKIIEYFAAGLPVIASGTGQTSIMLRDSEAGIQIGHSGEELAEAAIELLQDRARYHRYSQAAIDYSWRFDWNLLIEEANNYLTALMADN